MRDILGIGLSNAGVRTIAIAPEPAGLTWARGTTFIDGQPVTVNWQATPSHFAVKASVPTGWVGRFRVPTAYRNWKRTTATGADLLTAESHEFTFDGTSTLELKP